MDTRKLTLLALLAALPIARAQASAPPQASPVSTTAERGFNVDFGVAYGVPGIFYAAASSQIGIWNQVGLGSSSLLDAGGSLSPVFVNVYADTETGNANPPPSTDPEELLKDNFYSANGSTWIVDVVGLSAGEYLVYLYAPDNAVVPTGTMSVDGTAVASLPGEGSSAMIEGTSWAKVPISFSGGILTITGSGASFSGLAGLQILPFDSRALNVDFGSSGEVPSLTYPGTSGQAGHWNEVRVGTTPLADLSGDPTGASLVLNAESGNGAAGGGAANETEKLLEDNFYSGGGLVWTATVSGLADGVYRLFLYAPSHFAVSTGDLVVGGVPVTGLPGNAGSALVEGESWMQLPVSVTGGALAISGSGAGFSGLAGLQLQPLEGPTAYCTAGTSASGCQSTLSATGIPSASAKSGFSLLAANVEGDKDGLFFFGANGRQASPWGNGTSFQCVVPPVKRGGLLNGTGTAGACDGSFAQDLNALWCASCPKPLKNPGAGAVVQAQLWYRDPFNTSNQTTSLSDAIEFCVHP